MITQIGAAVREERLKRRLSIRELAELSGTSPATISRLENGKVRLMSNGIRKILKVLDISEDDGEKRIQRIIDILKAEDEAENDYNDAYTRGISHGINFALALLTGGISLDEVEHAQNA